ncbi:hypothetical protein AN964_01885 [Heyndrickxia shackletonii]|uniref:Uncharacterized protein n=2 Tax=Heyndrickxia shackletonii TaxID=157838 RepID=A0A0Q3WUK2_9BACI|nr:hypothetical protein AN964_01885 [Heyndrickxia shackletonii]
MKLDCCPKREGKSMYNQSDQIGNRYHSLQTKIWLHHDVFSGHWWTIVILNILFLIVFLMLMDRYRILLITFSFLVNFVIVGFTDEIGTYFNAWSYPHQLAVFTHRLNAVDFFVVPISMSLTYQYFSKWKMYILSSILLSAIICFIAAPIFVYFHLYEIENWNYFYSFVVMMLMLMLSKIFVDFVFKKSEKYA